MINPPHSHAENPCGAMQSITRRKPPIWVLILITAISSFALQIVVPAMPGLQCAAEGMEVAAAAL